MGRVDWYEAGKHYVQVREAGGGFVRREVSLGVRGSARSEVRDGLAAGDAVLLVAGGADVPAASEPADDTDAAADDEA